MATQSPVKPAVLQWALAEDGRPLSDIAERTGVSVSELESWLLGDAAPGRGQLSKLAGVLDRSRVTLLLPAPPVAASTPTAFRRAAGTGNEVSGKARKAVRESRQIQKALSWIRRDGGLVDLPQANYSDKPADVAAEVRQWVDVPVDTQIRWSRSAVTHCASGDRHSMPRACMCLHFKSGGTRSEGSRTGTNMRQ